MAARFPGRISNDPLIQPARAIGRRFLAGKGAKIQECFVYFKFGQSIAGP